MAPIMGKKPNYIIEARIQPRLMPYRNATKKLLTASVWQKRPHREVSFEHSQGAESITQQRMQNPAQKYTARPSRQKKKYCFLLAIYPNDFLAM